ncbi:MAG TPA: hypothetical protein VJN65_01005 [Bacteroidota bacterium]|nr:hypothetical protein [Bacteroidota bacterium]
MLKHEAACTSAPAGTAGQEGASTEMAHPTPPDQVVRAGDRTHLAFEQSFASPRLNDIVGQAPCVLAGAGRSHSN